MRKKTCLFLKASAAACALEESAIKANIETLGFGFEVVEWISPEDFRKQVAGKKLDIIYLGAHADGWGFGDTSTGEHPWHVLGNAICDSECMVPEGILFLGCCRGGMKTVALKILKQCDKIDYICGPNWNTRGGDLVPAFAAFVRNRLGNQEEPSVAVKRASEAAGQIFNCFDRQELEAEIEVLRNIERIQFSQAEIIRSQQALAQQLESIQTMLVGMVGTSMGFLERAATAPNLYPDDFPEFDERCCPETDISETEFGSMDECEPP